MEEIELREFFYMIYRRFWIVALITILSVATSGILSFFVLNPEYQTFTTLMVGKPKNYNDSIQYQDVILNQMLVKTYGEIAKSKTVTREIIENLDLDVDSKVLSDKVNVSLVSDTEIIKIQVTDTNPELAAKVANEAANVFMKHVSKIMKIENVQVIDKADVPTSSVKPRAVLNIVIAGLLGGMISVFIIFLIEYLDNTLKTPTDVECYLDLTVIGMIPKTT